MEVLGCSGVGSSSGWPGAEGVGKAGGTHGALPVPISVHHRPPELLRGSHMELVKLFRISA